MTPPSLSDSGPPTRPAPSPAAPASAAGEEALAPGREVRILLADDHVLFRKGLAALLAARPGMTVVGEARDGIEAVEIARVTAPDVVLMDIHMPRAGGLEAVRVMAREMPQVPVIMLTISDDDNDLFTAIKNGARGYLLKDMEPEQLFSMIEGVRRGEAPIAGVLAARILDEFRQRQEGARAGGKPRPYVHGAGRAVERGSGEPVDELSEREAEVLKLVAEGITNREIAAALSITENTVKIHLRNILEKLHLQNRTQATAYALRHGLVDDI